LRQSSVKVFDNREVFSGVNHLSLCAPEIATEARPGQFVMVRCGEDTLLRRPLSIHQVNETGEEIALLYSVVGKGTHWLSQLKSGENIDLLGPLGNGFSIYPASRKLLLVAGGMGIAPLYFLAQDAEKKGLSVTLLMGAQTAAQLEVCRPLSVETICATEDGTFGWKGLVTECLPDFVKGADQVFACGPMSMYRHMSRQKRRLKLEGKPVQISLEVRMGCGLGVCYACTVKTKSGLKQVCKDGPIFDLDDILWDELDLCPRW
jgi:dihydroorotate dehydrogenase electron transfer subunit